MPRGVNKVILLGNLGNDPDFTQTASGLQITKCSIATSKSWKDDQGQTQEKTEWHRVVFFKRLAEIASQYLKKGSQVYVEGELRTNSYEKDGVTRYSTEIIAREMQLLGGKPGGSSEYPAENNQYNPSPNKSAPPKADSPSNPASKDNKDQPTYDDIDQDIPF
ncbi:MAG: single-stranded DNA-binding protein [Gammaproteobacteria bacterium]|nr:single-stranded DNA-binding protein [Gammaproteobacteria bacterium]